MLLSRNSKQKLIPDHSTTALVQYTRNMLGEKDSFKSFLRFCTLGFIMLLLDHLHLIFLSGTSFSDIFSQDNFHTRKLGEITVFYAVTEVKSRSIAGKCVSYFE